MRAWPKAERQSFADLALVVAPLPLAAWPRSERRALLRLMRAKGGRSERAYARLLDAHQRFRKSLERRVRARG